MKWEIRECVPGDMIRVKAGSIYHYGIYVSDVEVIQFGLAPNLRKGLSDKDIAVLSSDIDVFRNGNFPEVAVPSFSEKLKKNNPKKTIEKARSRIGETGYHLLNNNCEHFAYECAYNKKYCSQTDDVREFMKKMPVLDVYFMKISELFPESEANATDQGTDQGAYSELFKVIPESRTHEIEACKSKAVREEKTAVWKLLEYALSRSFGYKIEQLHFEKNAHGKWTCDECSFSLTHTKGYVACAVSREPVGIDLEYPDRLKVSADAFADKVLTDREKESVLAESDRKSCDYDQQINQDTLIRFWSKKEALFKAYGSEGFIPKDWDTLQGERLAEVVLDSSVVPSEMPVCYVASEQKSVLRTYRVSLQNGKLKGERL